MYPEMGIKCFRSLHLCRALRCVALAGCHDNDNNNSDNDDDDEVSTNETKEGRNEQRKEQTNEQQRLRRTNFKLSQQQ